MHKVPCFVLGQMTSLAPGLAGCRAGYTSDLLCTALACALYRELFPIKKSYKNRELLEYQFSMHSISACLCLYD